MKYYIYSLNCPIENKIKYIGMSKDPKKRLYSHTSECYFDFLDNTKNRKNQPKIDWIAKLKNEKLKPIVNIICEFNDKKDAMAKELELIKSTPDLFNSKKLHYKKD